MGGDEVNTDEINKGANIEVEELPKTLIKHDENQTLPQYQEPNRPITYDQNYYNDDAPNYNYNQRRTPSYQQRVDGQPVYYETYPTQPLSGSRGGSIYYFTGDDNSDYPIAEMFENSFNTVCIRNRFIQRVYTILSIQLLITFGFILLAIYEKATRHFFQQNSIVLLLVSMLCFVIIYTVLICCEDLRRTVPINFFLLGLLTLFMTVMLSSISVHTRTNIVLYAIGTTCLVCLLVSIFAIQTKWDVTGCGMCLCIATIVLLLFGLIIMIMHLCGYRYKILDMVYSSIATLLFCFWLMYDTQQIIGGRRIELSPEEYIVGALSLYVDIAYIFMHILTLYTLCSR